MWLKGDRQTPAEQAKSGLKIAGAIVASTTVLILVAHASVQIATARGLGNVAAGWLLMAAITATLALTVQYWGRWFGVIPGNVSTRLSLAVLVGWFSPKGYMFVGFPVLLWVMAGLSFRFSTMKRVSGIDRATLIVALGCLIASLSGMFSPEPKPSAVVFAALGDLSLLVSYVAANGRKACRLSNRLGDSSAMSSNR